MFKYILKRLLQLIPILIGITFLSFAMMRLAGGDAVTGAATVILAMEAGKAGAKGIHEYLSGKTEA